MPISRRATTTSPCADKSTGTICPVRASNQCSGPVWAKKGLEFADIGYVLVSGQTAIAGKGDELLNNPDVGRLFLGG